MGPSREQVEEHFLQPCQPTNHHMPQRKGPTFLRFPSRSYEIAVLVVISLMALASLPPTPFSADASDLPRASEALTWEERTAQES